MSHDGYEDTQRKGTVPRVRFQGTHRELRLRRDYGDGDNDHCNPATIGEDFSSPRSRPLRYSQGEARREDPRAGRLMGNSIGGTERHREAREDRVPHRACPKLDKFSGKSSWKDFWGQFQRHRKMSGWGEMEAASLLGMHLTGDALCYFGHLPEETCPGQLQL